MNRTIISGMRKDMLNTHLNRISAKDRPRHRYVLPYVITPVLYDAAISTHVHLCTAYSYSFAKCLNYKIHTTKCLTYVLSVNYNNNFVSLRSTFFVSQTCFKFLFQKQGHRNEFLKTILACPIPYCNLTCLYYQFVQLFIILAG